MVDGEKRLDSNSRVQNSTFNQRVQENVKNGENDEPGEEPLVSMALS